MLDACDSSRSCSSAASCVIPAQPKLVIPAQAKLVIPAQAGIALSWLVIPAIAGMTSKGKANERFQLALE